MVNRYDRDLILSNRSCRRFDEGFVVERRTLEELVDLARLSASAANLQPLKYILSYDAGEECPDLSASGVGGLSEGLGRTGPGRAARRLHRHSRRHSDQQDLRLRPRHRGPEHPSRRPGKGTGRLHDRPDPAGGAAPGRSTSPPQYEILLVLALGKPREQVVIDEVGPNGDIKYWRDSDGVHHVPKRSLQELIID